MKQHKMIQWKHLFALWSVLWPFLHFARIFAASWRALARLGCVWVAICVCLGAFGRSLGAILGVLGGSWERLWRVFGGSWGAWGVHLGLRRSIFERLVAILIDFTRIAKTLKKPWFLMVFWGSEEVLKLEKLKKTAKKWSRDCERSSEAKNNAKRSSGRSRERRIRQHDVPRRLQKRPQGGWPPLTGRRGD